MLDASAEPSVDILLGTYNGERHLAAQIASVQAQTDGNWRLLVRDDGSRDSTVAIIDAVAAVDPRIVRIDDSDGNLGFLDNFARLLRLSRAPYVMFCDQDDIWLPTKLAITRSRMLAEERRHVGRPVLVHCDARVVDEALTEISPRFVARRARRRGLPAVLFVNCVQGATLMMNAPLRARTLATPTALMHDHQAAVIAELTGVRSFIDSPLMLYRQHGLNALGAGTTPTSTPVAASQGGVPANIRLALGTARHVEHALVLFVNEAGPAPRRHMRRFAYVLHGRWRLGRAALVFVENYAFPGRLDLFRLAAAILRGRLDQQHA